MGVVTSGFVGNRPNRLLDLRKAELTNRHLVIRINAEKAS